jgi:hypothetical protein
MWSNFMRNALETLPDERFVPPTTPDPSTLKPVMKGIWRGGQTYTIDTISGKIATEFTPSETKKEIPIQSVHSILYWLDKNDPLGPAPVDPTKDPQFERWETPVRKWAIEQKILDDTNIVIPTAVDDVHTEKNTFSISIQNIDSIKKYNLSDEIVVNITSSGKYPILKASLYVNETYIGTAEKPPFIFRFSPREIGNISENNTIKATAYDSIYNKNETETTFSVALDN